MSEIFKECQLNSIWIIILLTSINIRWTFIKCKQIFNTLRKWLVSGKINGDIFVDLIHIFIMPWVWAQKTERYFYSKFVFQTQMASFRFLSLAGSLRKPDYLPPQGPLLVPEKGDHHEHGHFSGFWNWRASKLNSGGGKSYHLSGSSSTKAHTWTHTHVYIQTCLVLLLYFMKVADYK